MAFLAIGGEVNDIAGFRQRFLQQPLQVLVVFHKQDAHGFLSSKSAKAAFASRGWLGCSRRRALESGSATFETSARDERTPRSPRRRPAKSRIGNTFGAGWGTIWRPGELSAWRKSFRARIKIAARREIAARRDCTRPRPIVTLDAQDTSGAGVRIEPLHASVGGNPLQAVMRLAGGAGFGPLHI